MKKVHPKNMQNIFRFGRESYLISKLQINNTIYK